MVRYVFAFVVLVAAAAVCCAKDRKKTEHKAEKLDYDESILKHFKQPSDTTSLLAYLNDRSASDDDLLAIPDLINQLGDDRYARRQSASKKLLTLGLLSFEPLRSALSDKDAERAQGAQKNLQAMDRRTHTVSLPPVIIRMLMQRKPPELLAALLRYLPCTTDPEVEEELYYNIEELAVVKRRVDPLLVSALDDKVPARRAVAGCIVARCGTEHQRKAAEELLRDFDPYVRLRTAQGFLAGCRTVGISTLIELLDRKPIALAWQAEELLIWAAGEKAPEQLVWSGGETAKAARNAWETWWKKAETTFDPKALSEQPRQPRFFHQQTGGTSYWLIGSNGELRYDSNPNNTLEQTLLLPNGRLFGFSQEQRAETVNGFERSVQKLHCHEQSVEGETITKRNWHEDADCPDWAQFSPNGIVWFRLNELEGMGVDGKVFPKVGLDREPRLVGSRRMGIPRSVTDGLIWLEFWKDGNSMDQLSCLALLDPQGGKILTVFPIAENGELKEIVEIYYFSRGRILFRTKLGLWRFERGAITRLDQIRLLTIGSIEELWLLRNSDLIVYQDSNIIQFTSKSQVRSKLGCRALRSGGSQAYLPFALISFGF